MGSFSDKFKNDSLRGTVNKLQEKYRPQDIKHMSQDRAVEVLEREKSLEKDDKMRGNYDIIIQAIKEFFAKKYDHKIWFSKLFNPFVWLGSFFLQSLNKMFASYYYDPEMSKMDFDYQLVSQEESFEKLEVTEANRKLG